MAEQLEFFSLPNPCRGVCQSDARGYCRGCLRSRDERFQWGGMNDSQKREVLRLCHQRYLRLRRAAAAGGDVLPEALVVLTAVMPGLAPGAGPPQCFAASRMRIPG